jgi:hypothetical protein
MGVASIKQLPIGSVYKRKNREKDDVHTFGYRQLDILFTTTEYMHKMLIDMTDFTILRDRVSKHSLLSVK